MKKLSWPWRRTGPSQEGADVPLRMVVGLGNPGGQYERTRHNVGFMCVNRLAAQAGLSFRRTKLRADIARGAIADMDTLLVQPQTFMNDSGLAVGSVARYYQIPFEHIVVIYDDIDLPFGTVRVRARGSSGGHRGIQSIIDHLHTNEFPRIKVGIGRRGDPVRYVLGPFSAEQTRELPDLCDRVAEIAKDVLTDGVIAAMNRHNGEGARPVRTIGGGGRPPLL